MAIEKKIQEKEELKEKKSSEKKEKLVNFTGGISCILR